MSDVRIKDLDMFASCVNDLSGGRAVLDKTAERFRTWPGQPDGCSAAVKMPGKHDIGLQRQSDGSYVPVFDPYSMDRVFQSTHGTNRVGLLFQEYALRTAEYEAAQQGYSTQRITGEKGVISLEVITG